MTPEAMFTAALQLEEGWKVTECRLEGEPRRLLLKLDFEKGKRLWLPTVRQALPNSPAKKRAVQKHWNGVVAFLKTRLTNGAIEAVNGLLQLAKRLARVFAPCATSVSWPISKPPVFISICRWDKAKISLENGAKQREFGIDRNRGAAWT